MKNDFIKDIQKEKDIRGIDVDNVGIEDLEYPIQVMDKNKQVQSTVAKIKMSVFLSKHFRGTHTSRFLEIIHEYCDLVSVTKIKKIVQAMQEKFEADKSSIEISFPYFIKKEAPISKIKSYLSYQCRFIAEMNKDFDLIVEVVVPIHSLCPCSKEISKYGGHDQRGLLAVQVRMNHLIWIEELVQMAEETASAEIYSLLKRVDEKYVTEKAYKNPRFVEDITREMVIRLDRDKRISWYNIFVKNFESIHNHNIFASLKKWKEKK